MIIPATTFSLGVWQLYRLQWKLNLLDSLSTIEPQPLDLNTKTEFVLSKCTGTFIDLEKRLDRPKSVDGQVKRGQLVFQPFLVTDGALGTVQGSQTKIIVNRGWVPLNYPKLDIEPNQEIIGITRKGENFLMGSNRIDLESFSKQLNTLPVLLELIDRQGNTRTNLSGMGSTQSSKKGYPIQRDSYMSNNHLEYALTWFGLSISTMLMLKRRNKRIFKWYLTIDRMHPIDQVTSELTVRMMNLVFLRPRLVGKKEFRVKPGELLQSVL